VSEKNYHSIIPGAESVFTIQDHAPGILLLHGFMGSPQEMSHLGDALIRDGYSISIPRLPGHGTSIDECIKTGSQDWLRAAHEAFLELRRQCPEIYIVGFSLGALLALLLAEKFDPARIVLIAPPHKIKSSEKNSIVAKLTGNNTVLQDQIKTVRDPDARENHICYNHPVPKKLMVQLNNCITRAGNICGDITIPSLILQSEKDTVLSKDSADFYYQNLASKDKEILTFSRSYHVLTLDFDRDAVNRAVLQFIDYT
jgi:carboxylesterase